MIAFFQLIGGLILLVYAGDSLIRGSISIAQRFKVPPMIVGLTVVAFGTSAPELVVGIDAVLTKVPTLALGNVVGSNIANVWLVVGLPAILAPMVCKAPKLTTNMLAMIATTVGFIALAFTGAFTFEIGLILLTGLFIFLYMSSRKKRTGSYKEILEEIEGLPKKPDPVGKATLFLLGGLAGLSIGAHFFVQGAVEFARILGVSEAVIGLTLVAIGTSIPELVTAIAASLRNHCEVALGNILGSNIFNLMGIIGVASLFGDIPVPTGFLKFDLWVMLGASLTLIPFVVLNKNVGRYSGLVFCLAYGLYIVFLAQGVSGIDYNGPIGEIM